MAGVTERISLAAPARADGHHEAIRCHHADILCNAAVFQPAVGVVADAGVAGRITRTAGSFGATPADGHIAWAPPLDSEGETNCSGGVARRPLAGCYSL